MSRHDADRAELAERAGRGQDDAVRDRGTDRRERDAAERLPCVRPERRGRLLLLGADLAQDRRDLAHDERQRHEDRREDDPRRREDHTQACRRERAAEPALLAVDQHERQADDDRRDHERQVDDALDDGLAAELGPLERQGARDPEGGVQRDRDADDERRQAERVQGIGCGERVDQGTDAMLEGAVEDHADREKEQQSQVAEREHAQTDARLHLDHLRPSIVRRLSITTERTSSTTDTAAAPGSSPDWMRPYMKTDETSVLNGRFPEIRTTEPNSPRARPRARPAPEMIAGARLGSTTFLNVVKDEAPSDAAASSDSRSSSIRTGCTERATNGSVTNNNANRTAQRVNAMSIGAGPFGP